MSLESVEQDFENLLRDPAPDNDDGLKPVEVIASRGHQLLTLHSPTSSDSSEQLNSESDIGDITHDLPDSSPLSDCQQAFGGIKDMLITPAVLRRADPDLPYILQTDWSPTAVGAILVQEDAFRINGEEHPVAFASKMLKGPELNYSATEGECFAVVSFVEHFRSYLWGRPFTLKVDHWCLKWLMTSTQQNSRLARWSLKLQEYAFRIRHRRGSQNGNADAMSRPPVASAVEGATVMVLAMETAAAQGDSDEDRITYAAGRTRLPRGGE